MGRKIHIRQTDSYDCGAACLASVAAWWGVNLPLSRFRRECGCSKDGISIRGLCDGAESVGLSAKPLKAEDFKSLSLKDKIERLQALSSVQSPVIAHIVSDGGMMHYVVIFKTGKRKLGIMDPAMERMSTAWVEDFAKKWSGYIILVTSGDGIGRENKTQGKLARFRRLLFFHRREIILAAAGSIALSGIGICNSLLLQILIDKILPSSDTASLAIVSAIILTLIPVSLLIGYMRDLYLLQGSISIDTSLVIGFMRKIMKMDARFFKDYPKGELESRLSDTGKIRAFICQGVVSLIVCLTTLLVVTTLMFVFYSRLAALLCCCIPVYALLLGAADRINRKMSRKVMAAASAFESDVIDSMEGEEAIRHFGVDARTLNFNDSYSDLVYKSFKAGKVSAAIGGLGNGISQIIMALILIVGGAGVVCGNLSLGELVSFYTLSIYFISPVSSLVSFDSLMNEALTASDRIYDITSSYSLAREDNTSGVSLSGLNSLTFEFKNVTFRYPGGRKLLEGFSASFESGKITGIQGPNGCGKSTLISLMLKDYKPSEGTLTYGGIDISFLSSTCWRGIISLAPQKFHIFNATIFDNIAMTLKKSERNIDHTMLEKVAWAASLSGMDRMCEKLDKGLFSGCGTGGVSLSGGEKQMIVIARTLYANTPVVVFDEASSNMDIEGREAFARMLLELRRMGKCVIVISHDESFAHICDKVIKLTG